jgi:hypothetical protein
MMGRSNAAPLRQHQGASMHKYLCVALGVAFAIVALTWTSVESWSLPVYTIKQNSGLFKARDCGSDPTDCSWCTKNHHCYSVTECKGGKCTVVAVAPNSVTDPSKVNLVSNPHWISSQMTKAGKKK